MSVQSDVLWATGNKFFPGWAYETGADEQNFWIRLDSGSRFVQVNVPASTPLDKFEEAAWLSFRSERDAYDLARATEEANG